ncbi:MAG: linear amide C-N hydrolase [Alphaproteobacteria bacterium]|nr:linear amide C-N hydrolase [Alphaproteobacteria bacterium]
MKKIAIYLFALLLPTSNILACTGISLRSVDGAVIAARTVEWALGDANHDQFVISPRGHAFVGQTPAGLNGKRWTAQYGFVSLMAYGQPFGPDGINEAGLYVGMYYFPDFMSLAPFDPAQADRSLSVGDFMQWMLSSFRSVAQVREALGEVRVVNVDDPRFGAAPLPFHWKIADPTGASVIIEIVDGGQVRVHEAFLGVVTNSPSYDWHLTNLRNYVGLVQGSRAPIEIDGRRFAPLGAGSGLLGLPGDFTPPSRFVRAAVMTATARPLASAQDAVFEAFRILDNFNIPLGSLAATAQQARDIAGATQITTATDLSNRILYFHTVANREVRMINLNRIDFTRPGQRVIDAGATRQQVVREIELR